MNIMTIIIIKIEITMIRTDKTDSVSSHHPELVDVPVREVGLVQDCHLLDEEDEEYEEDDDGENDDCDLDDVAT